MRTIKEYSDWGLEVSERHLVRVATVEFYEVDPFQSRNFVGPNGAMGRTSWLYDGRAVIRIKTGMADDETRETILHEITHATFGAMEKSIPGYGKQIHSRMFYRKLLGLIIAEGDLSLVNVTAQYPRGRSVAKELGLL